MNPSPARPPASPWVTGLLWTQGVYYLATGLWPLLSIETFQQVTGPKTDHLQARAPTEADHWLVMTVAVLVVAVAASLLTAALRRNGAAETVVLAACAAVGLTAIDAVYVSREVIAPIYLADAAVEVAFLLGWALGIATGRGRAAGSA